MRGPLPSYRTELGQAEVTQLGFIKSGAREQDIPRLDVAVEHARSMRFLDRPR